VRGRLTWVHRNLVITEDARGMVLGLGLVLALVLLAASAMGIAAVQVGQGEGATGSQSILPPATAHPVEPEPTNPPAQTPSVAAEPKWPTFPVEFCVVPSTEISTDALASSVLWAGSLWRVPVLVTGVCGGAIHGDGQNEVGWKEFVPDVGGLTTTSSNGDRLVEADIEIATGRVWSADPTSETFKVIMAHEMGHALGILHHLPPPALMAPVGPAEPVLTDADISAIRDLYPKFWQ
jgi:hypothetical protein